MKKNIQLKEHIEDLETQLNRIEFLLTDFFKKNVDSMSNATMGPRWEAALASLDSNRKSMEERYWLHQGD